MRGKEDRKNSANSLERVEEQIREKPIELNHDARCQGEPNGGKNWCGGEKFLHGF
jgi:hypothetical protein